MGIKISTHYKLINLQHSFLDIYLSYSIHNLHTISVQIFSLGIFFPILLASNLKALGGFRWSILFLQFPPQWFGFT